MEVVCEDEGVYPTFPSLIIYYISIRSVSQFHLLSPRTTTTECADPRPELLLIPEGTSTGVICRWESHVQPATPTGLHATGLGF